MCLALLSLKKEDYIYFKNRYKIEHNILNKEILNNIDIYSIKLGKTVYFSYIENNKVPFLSYNKLN